MEKSIKKQTSPKPSREISRLACPGGPLCIVQFDDFARFAEQWLYSGTGLAGDIDKDGNVDIEDLRQFADYWLSCCPYNWPLR